MNGSFWAALSGLTPSNAKLDRSIRSQTAIVGAGFTGLSAALHLAEQGHDVVVLEAEEPGFGASGRNGGQVIAGLKYDPETLMALFPGERGIRLVKAAGQAPDLVFSLITRHRIDCHARRSGWLQLALCEADLKILDRRIRQWQAAGAAPTLLDKAGAARRTGSPLYHGAMFDPRGGTLNPLAYAQGLAAAAMHAGARIFAQSRATRLSRQGNQWHLETNSGAVHAENIILATNAYADNLHPALRRSVVAVPSFQIVTEILPEAVANTILPQGGAGSDMRRLLRYFRLHQGRLLMGGRGSFAEPPPASLQAALRAAIVEIFPQAAAARIEHGWGGMVAVTPDHLPHAHEIAPGLLAGLGYNGRGVAMATLMGQVLAKRALGTDAEDLAFPLTQVQPMKLHRFSRLGANASMQYARLRDRLSA